MDKFLESKLCNFLGFEIPKEMIDHILNLRTEPEIREYFNGLLDKSDHKQRQFVNEFINKRNLKTPPNKSKNRKKNSKPNNIPAKNSGLQEIKSDFDELEKKYQIASKKESKDKSDDKNNMVTNNINTKSRKYENPYEKYKKFVPFDFSKESYPLLPGRKLCGCYAKRHNLINNCTECGRIQCEQEGSGPCMFCGALVVSIEEKAIIDSDSTQGEALVKKLFNQPKPEGWEAAVENQKKLRDADISRQEKQRIVDDQSDYFILTRSVWSDKNDMNDICKQIKENAERVALQKIANKSKTNVSLINESEKNEIDKCMNNKRQIKSKKNEKQNIPEKKSTGIRFGDEWRLNTARDLDMECQVAKIEKDVEDYLENLPIMRMPELREKLFYQDPRTSDFYSINYNNEYDWDNEFWELNDYFDRLGFCISIRQPFASLIMAGIKTHEGRDWNVDLRGIIWIAAAAKKPSQEEIERIENFYKRKNENKDIKFPKSYPTGRLLGRAQIVSCLKHEEYLQKFPDGEVDDNFAIILDDIIPLPILIPLKGYSGIYLLPKKLHTAAGLMIRKLLQETPLTSDVN